MANRYIKLSEQDKFSFITLPKSLFSDYYKNLSCDAKVVYSILLDRTNLSRENNWVDDNKNIYIYYSREAIQEYLGFGKNKVINIFKELVSFDLLEEVRQGFHLPNILYVKKFFTFAEIAELDNKELLTSSESNSKPSTVPDVDISDIQTFENQTSIGLKSKPLLVSKSNPNKTEFINPELINQSIIENGSENNDGLTNNNSNSILDISTDDQGTTFESINELSKHFDISLDELNLNQHYKEYLHIIFDVINSSDPEISLSKSNKILKSMLIERLLSLTKTHFDYVHDAFLNNATNIRNLKSYILTSLYNSASTLNSFQKAQNRPDSVNVQSSNSRKKQHTIEKEKVYSDEELEKMLLNKNNQ